MQKLFGASGNNLKAITGRVSSCVLISTTRKLGNQFAKFFTHLGHNRALKMNKKRTERIE